MAHDEFRSVTMRAVIARFRANRERREAERRSALIMAALTPTMLRNIHRKKGDSPITPLQFLGMKPREDEGEVEQSEAELQEELASLRGIVSGMEASRAE